MTDGLKFDNGKPLVGCMLRIFPHALMAVGKQIEFGTHKYPEVDNWQKVDNAKVRYQDALMRHLLYHNMGEEIDKETGMPHIQAVAWNALAICELYLKEKEEQKTKEEERIKKKDEQRKKEINELLYNIREELNND